MKENKNMSERLKRKKFYMNLVMSKGVYELIKTIRQEENIKHNKILSKFEKNLNKKILIGNYGKREKELLEEIQNSFLQLLKDTIN